MWYRNQLEANKKNNNSPYDRGYEAKIIRGCAERVVRKMFRLKRIYNPTDKEINSKVNKIINTLKERYRNLNNVRLHVDGENISPIVEQIAKEIFP